MAKTLANYDPLVQIPSGMTPAGADFPIVESHDILVGENDKRLDAKLDDIDSAIGNVGQTPIATQLSSKVNTSDIQTTVRDASSASDSKIPSEKAVRSAIDSKTINVDSTVTQGSTNAVSGGAVHTQLATKQDVLTFDTTPTASSSNPVTSGGVKSALDAKQDTLTFDTTPTVSSSNPVTSGGVKAALDTKQNTLTYETTPIAGSVNPVTSTGIRNAIDAAAAGNLGQMQAQYDEFVTGAEDVLEQAKSLSNGMVACSNIDAETTVGDTRILLYTGTTNSTYTNGHWYYNSAPSNAAPSWTDGGAVGSAPTIDNTLTVEGAAANSKSVGDAIKNIVTISNTQPGSDSGNKVWIKETTSEEVQIPTYAEHIAKANKADIATNNESDNGSGTISASKKYAIGDHFYINNTNTSSENFGVSTLYKATAAIASGDAIVVGTNCEASKVADEITSLSNDLDNVKADLTVITGNAQIEFISGGYIRLSDATADINSIVQNAQWRHAVIACVEGDSFTVSGAGGNAPRMWGFIASDGTVLSVANASSVETQKVLTAPENSAYLVLNDNSNAVSYYGILVKKQLSNDIDILNESLSELDSTVNGETSCNYVEGKNLYVYGTIHDIIDDSGASISDYIPITLAAGDKVAFVYTDDENDTTQYYLCFFDSNKEFISSRVRNPVPTMLRTNLEIPSGAAYIRISFKKGFEGALMDSYSTSLYKATKTFVSNGIIQNIGSIDELDTVNKDNIVAAINEVKSSAPSFPVKPRDTTFFVSSVNLVNPDTCVSGQFVNQTNGNFANNQNHKRTDYIAVEPNKSYFVVSSDNIAREIRYVFYKSDKTFSSGALIESSQGFQIITSPANAAYIVVSMAIKLDFMIAQTDTVIPFESYHNIYIDKQYINLGSDIIMNLPAKIYAMVGYELNIYFENIVENWTKYDWNVDCTIGKQMERGYTITPVESDVGTKTLTIKATDEYGNTKTITSSLIIASASAGNGSSKSVIIFGDSTTNNGIVIEKLNANFASDVMNVSTLGTRGTAPNLHEGRSGWRLETYFTTEYVDYTDGRGHVENPFYNPTSQTFDASYYFSNSGVSVPDYFVVNMGINDVFSPANDTTLATAIDQFVDYTDAIITSLRTVSQTVKICICCTIPPNHSQDAFGKAYKCGQTRNRYKRNNLLLVERLIDEYDGRESEGIYLIPIHTNLDTVYNMGMETLPVNARNTDVTYQSPIANGGVHPVASGYWQIADVYTAFLKANA